MGRPVTSRLWLTAAVLLLAGLWLGARSFDVNLMLACQNSQWPGFEHCADQGALPPGSGASEGVVEVPPEQATQVWQQVRTDVQRLRERIARNPGDAWAVSELARYADLPAETLGVDSERLLAAATQVAPQHALVQEQLARRALERSDWAAAVPALVRLSRHHATRKPPAPWPACWRPPAGPHPDGRAAPGPATDPRWFEAALRTLPGLKLPVAPSLPLVADLALAGELKAPVGLLVIRQLKAEGLWLDAHAIWQRLWNRPVPLLFNGDFELAFVRDGFDWVLADDNPQRTGVKAERIGQGERGQVMRLQFNSRPLRTPLLRQDMFVPAGHYRLEGEHRSLDLRSSGGLAWVLSCANGGRELTRSEPLTQTGRDWRDDAPGRDSAGRLPGRVAVPLTPGRLRGTHRPAGRGLAGQPEAVAAPGGNGTGQPGGGPVIDLHSHILPGIDDGAPTLEVSLEMARIAVADGIHTMACTPHIYPGMYMNDGPGIERARAALQAELDRAGIALRLVTGADVHLVPGLLPQIRAGQVPTLNGSRYLLLEPSHTVAPPRFEDSVFNLVASGYTPVITHPERLTWVEDHYPVFRRLVQQGAWMQVTAGALTGVFGKRPGTGASVFWPKA
jgi:tyrosine-protein phosphatase YwqE